MSAVLKMEIRRCWVSRDTLVTCLLQLVIHALVNAQRMICLAQYHDVHETSMPIDDIARL